MPIDVFFGDKTTQVGLPTYRTSKQELLRREALYRYIPRSGTMPSEPLDVSGTFDYQNVRENHPDIDITQDPYDLQNALAEDQTIADIWANAAFYRTGAGLLGGAGSFAEMMDLNYWLLGSIFGTGVLEDKPEASNWLTDITNDLRDKIQKESPFYRRSDGKDTAMYLFDNWINLADSITGFALGGAGAARVGSKVFTTTAKLLTRGGAAATEGTAAAATAEKTGIIAEALAKLAKITKNTKDLVAGGARAEATIAEGVMGAGAATGTAAELGVGSRLAAAAVADGGYTGRAISVAGELSARSKRIVDGSTTLFTAISSNAAEGMQMAEQVGEDEYMKAIHDGYSEKEAQARRIAAQNRTVNMNRWNILLNLTSASRFLRTNPLRSFEEKGVLQSLKRYGLEMGQEGLEETWNEVATQYGYGKVHSLEDIYNIYGKASTWEQGAWGAVGGGGNTVAQRHVLDRMNFTVGGTNFGGTKVLVGKNADGSKKYEYKSNKQLRDEGYDKALELVKKFREADPSKLDLFLGVQAQNELVDRISNLYDERSVAIKNKDVKKVSEIEEEIKKETNNSFALSVVNAMRSGTLTQLEDVLKGYSKLSPEAAKALNLPTFYHEDAIEGLEKIKRWEKLYTSGQNKFLNNDQVFLTAVNTEMWGEHVDAINRAIDEFEKYTKHQFELDKETGKLPPNMVDKNLNFDMKDSDQLAYLDSKGVLEDYKELLDHKYRRTEQLSKFIDQLAYAKSSKVQREYADIAKKLKDTLEKERKKEKSKQSRFSSFFSGKKNSKDNKNSTSSTSSTSATSATSATEQSVGGVASDATILRSKTEAELEAIVKDPATSSSMAAMAQKLLDNKRLNRGIDTAPAEQKDDAYSKLLESLAELGVDTSSFAKVTDAIKSELIRAKGEEEGTRIFNSRFEDIKKAFNTRNNANVNVDLETHNQQIADNNMAAIDMAMDNTPQQEAEFADNNLVPLQNSLVSEETTEEDARFKSEYGYNLFAYRSRAFRNENGKIVDIDNRLSSNFKIADLIDPNKYKVGTRIRIVLKTDYSESGTHVDQHNEDVTFERLKQQEKTLNGGEDNGQYTNALIPMGIEVYNEDTKQWEFTGAYLHNIPWVLNEDNVYGDEASRIADARNLMLIRNEVAKNGVFETKVLSRSYGHIIFDFTNQFRTVAENHKDPDLKIGIARNGEMRTDNGEVFTGKIFNATTDGVTYILGHVGFNENDEKTYVAIAVKRTNVDKALARTITKVVEAYLNNDPNSELTKKVNEYLGYDILDINNLQKFLNNYLYLYFPPNIHDTLENYLLTKKSNGVGIYVNTLKGSERIEFGIGGNVNNKPTLFRFMTRHAKDGGEQTKRSLKMFEDFLLKNMVSVSARNLGKEFKHFLIDEQGQIIKDKRSYNDFIKERLVTNTISLPLGNGKFAYTIQPSIRFETAELIPKYEPASAEATTAPVATEEEEFNDEIDAAPRNLQPNEEEALVESIAQNLLVEGTVTNEDGSTTVVRLSDGERRAVVNTIFSDWLEALDEEDKNTEVLNEWEEFIETVRLRDQLYYEDDLAISALIKSWITAFRSQLDGINALPEKTPAQIKRAQKLTVIIADLESKDSVIKKGISREIVYISNLGIEEANEDVGGDKETNQALSDDKNFKIDHSAKVLAKMKRFLSRVRIYVENKDGKQVPRKNFLGYYNTIPYYEVYQTIMELLANVNPDFDAMLAQLKKYQEAFPFLQDVVDSFERANTVENKDNYLQLKKQFVRTFAKETNDQKALLFSYNEANEVVLVPFSSNNTTLKTKILNSWEQNFFSKQFIEPAPDDSEELFHINKEQLELANNVFNEIKERALLKQGNYIEEIRSWLHSLGIDVDSKTLIQMSKTHEERGGIYISGKKKLWESAFKHNGIFTQIHRAFTRYTNVSDPRNSPFETTYLKALAALDSKYNSSVLVNSFRDINGDQFYGFNYYHYLSNKVRDLRDGQSNQYVHNLATSNFSRHSRILHALFNIRGVGNAMEILARKTHLNSIFSLSYADGSIFSDENTRVKLKDGGNGDQLLYALGLLQAATTSEADDMRTGQIMIPAVSNKIRALMLNTLLHKVSMNVNGGTGEATLEAVFNVIFMSEFDRITHYQEHGTDKADFKLFDEGYKYFYFLPMLNEVDALYDGRTRDEKGNIKDFGTLKFEIVNDSPELSSELKTLVKTHIKNFIDDEVTKTLELLKDNKLENIITKGYKRTIPDNITEVKHKRYLILDYVVNTMLANAEIHMLFAKDPALYYNSLAAEATTVNDKIVKTMENVKKRLAFLIAGGEYSGTKRNIRIIESKDPKLLSTNIEYLTKLNEKGLLSDEDLASYKDIKGTDAQEITTMQEHLQTLVDFGVISKGRAKELLDLDEAEKLSGEDLATLLKPIKPVHAQDIRYDGDTTNGIVYIKTASYPIIKQEAKTLELEKLRNWMLSNKVDKLVFSSGIKLGNKVSPITVFNNNGVFVAPDTVDDSQVTTLSKENYFIQQELPYKNNEDDYNTQIDGTQVRTLLFNGILDEMFTFKGKQVKGSDLEKEYIKLYKEIYSNAWKKLATELDFNEKDKTINVKALQRTLVKEAIARNWSVNDIKALSLDETGKRFKQPLWSFNNTDKLESLLKSIVDNRVRKVSRVGNSYTMVSDIGYKQAADAADDSTGNIIYTEFYDKEKGLQANQVFVPITLFKDEDGNQLDVTAIPKELLKTFLFRIPSQKHSSMGEGEIAGFLPASVGNKIVSTKDFVAQMGADNDADKLYVYNYALTIDDTTRKLVRGNTPEAVKSNNILDVQLAVLGSNNDKVKSLNYETTDYGDLAKIKDAISERLKSDELWSPLTPRFQRSGFVESQRTNSSISVFANDNSLNALLQGKNVVLANEIKLGGGVYDDLSSVTNNKGVRKGKVISARLSVAVDNEKLALLEKLNVNNSTYDFIKACGQLGIDEDVAMAFINQDIIRDFSRLKDIYNSIHLKKMKDKNGEIFAELLAIYQPSNYVDSKDYEEILQGYLAEIEKMDGKKLIALINSEAETDPERYRYLQMAILSKFNEISAIGAKLAQAQKLINTSSKGLPMTLMDSLVKQQEIVEFLQDNISEEAPIKNLNSLLGDVTTTPSNEDKSFLAGVVRDERGNEVKLWLTPQTINGLATTYALFNNNALWLDTQIFPYNSSNINRVFSELIQHTYIESGGETRGEAYGKVFKAIKSYVIANTDLLDTDTNIVADRVRLFVDSPSNKSLATVIRSLKANKVLASNYFLNSLEYDLGNIKTLSLIKFGANAKSTLREQEMYDSFASLFTNKRVLGSFYGKENYSTVDLARDIILYAYSSGANQAATNFLKYVPFEYIDSLGIGTKLNYLNFNDPNVLGISNNSISSFSLQYIQHNAASVPKIKVNFDADSKKVVYENINVLSKSKGRLEQFELTTDSKYFSEIRPLPEFLAVYNRFKVAGAQKHDLYRKVKNENKYVRIPTLGYKLVTEYNSDIRNTSSAVPMNNATNIVLQFPDLARKVSGKDYVIEYLQNIRDTSTNYYFIQIANAFLDNPDLFNNIRIEEIQSAEVKIREALKGRKAAFNRDSNILYLSSAMKNGGYEAHRIFLHELTHGYNAKLFRIFELKDALTEDPAENKRRKDSWDALSAKTKQIIESINDSYKEALASLTEEEKLYLSQIKENEAANARGEEDIHKDVKMRNAYSSLYGLTNIREFAAEAISSPVFQKRLGAIKSKSLIKRIIDLVKDLIHNFRSKFTVEEESILEDVIADLLTLIDVVEDNNIIVTQQATQEEFDILSNSNKLISTNSALMKDAAITNSLNASRYKPTDNVAVLGNYNKNQLTAVVTAKAIVRTNNSEAIKYLLANNYVAVDNITYAHKSIVKDNKVSQDELNELGTDYINVTPDVKIHNDNNKLKSEPVLAGRLSIKKSAVKKEGKWQKDEEMASASNKAIATVTKHRVGYLSSTRAYLAAIGGASTEFTANDLVWIFGASQFGSLTLDINKDFLNYYVPTINKAIEAGVTTFNVGRASGIDTLVADYLVDKGFIPNGKGAWIEFKKDTQAKPPVKKEKVTDAEIKELTKAQQAFAKDEDHTIEQNFYHGKTYTNTDGTKGKYQVKNGVRSSMEGAMKGFRTETTRSVSEQKRIYELAENQGLPRGTVTGTIVWMEDKGAKSPTKGSGGWFRITSEFYTPNKEDFNRYENWEDNVWEDRSAAFKIGRKGEWKSIRFERLKPQQQKSIDRSPAEINAIDAIIDELVKAGEITYVNEDGKPCAKAGGKPSAFTKGGKWELIKDLQGYPSHANGGVDIKIGKDGVSFRKGNNYIKAGDGLVLTKVENNERYTPEYESMSKVLTERNKHLDWVERALNPNKYPFLIDADGKQVSHKLSYATGDNGDAYVYPTVILNADGKLEELSKEDAMEYAKKTNTAMRIPNVKLAEYYSKNGLIKH